MIPFDEITGSRDAPPCVSLAQSRNPKKVYATDPGIYNQAKTAFSDDSGRQLENAVFLHLRRRHREIFFFNKQGECDFVVMEKGKAVACIQVCWKVDDMNMMREICIYNLSFYFWMKFRNVRMPLFHRDTFMKRHPDCM